MVILFISGVLIGATHWLGLQNKSKPPEIFLVPPKELKYFTFGYNESLADSLWLRFLQDADVCKPGEVDKKRNPIDATPSTDSQSPVVNSETPAKGRDSVFFIPTTFRKAPPRCDRGWSFYMIDAITELAPRFREAFVSGATLLSVALDDINGATIIYKKGLPLFDTYWPFAYQAAQHFLNEVHDEKFAAELLVKAGKNGAPQWVFALAAKVYTRQGQAFLAKTVLENELQRDPEGRFAPRIRERLAEVNQVIEEEKHK